MTFNRTTALGEIAAMLAKEKHFSEWPQWEPLQQKADGSFGFLVGLAIEGLSIAGVRLRGGAPYYPADRDVRIQLECLIAGRWRQVSRCEYRPLSGHKNPFNATNVPRAIEVGVSHCHDFDLNASLGIEAMMADNLRLAAQIEPPPASLHAFLSHVGHSLGIDDLGSIGAPPWQRRLL